MLLIGYADYGEILLNQENKLGIRNDYTIDSFQTLVYELQLPLNLLFPGFEQFDLSSKTISICLESGAANSEDRLVSGGGQGGSGRPGGRERPEGNYSDGRQGGARPDAGQIQQLSEPIKIWIKRIALTKH
jgi:hypothetical protein